MSLRFEHHYSMRSIGMLNRKPTSKTNLRLV